MYIDEIAKKSNWTDLDVKSLAIEGYEFLISGNPDIALSCFETAHILNPREHYYVLMLGICNCMLNREDIGIELFKKASSIKEDKHTDLHMLKALLSLNKFSEAKEKAIELKKYNDQFYTNFANGVLEILSKM